MKMQKFKLNQEVYDTTYGWGKVVERKEDCYEYPIKVEFYHRQKGLPLLEYTIGGVVKGGNFKTLSTRSYQLVGFCQEDKLPFEDCLYKWGMFRNSFENDIIISKLTLYVKENEHAFRTTDKTFYKFFEPLTEEQIKVLGLCD
jgi:hypothetical protein|nr:MAG TPA: hypothetical protein [Caudoviricetes sp.]